MTEAKETSVKTKFETLNELVIEWGVEKGIINGTEIAKFKQFAKVVEEFSEMKQAIIARQIHDVKDGIGDTVVTLIIFSKQCRFSILENFKIEKPVHSLLKEISEAYSIQLMDSYVGCLSKSLLKDDLPRIEMYVNYLLEHLKHISIENNTTLTNCLEIAYNEIKDRKGKTVNGTFIKQADLNSSIC